MGPEPNTQSFIHPSEIRGIEFTASVFRKYGLYKKYLGSNLMQGIRCLLGKASEFRV